MSTLSPTYLPLLMSLLEVRTLFPTYLPLLMSLLALATLFIYRPKKFKVLPWIVLAVMILMSFFMTFFYSPPILWGNENFDYIPIYISFENFSFWFWWIGKANLSGYARAIVPAIPILTLWIVLIVDVVQKKKQKKTI